MNKSIAYCGLDCEKCDAYRATVNDDQELREKTALLWSELNHTQISADEICCEGCQADGRKTYYCSSICGIRRCALERKTDSCGKCPDMKECQILSPFLKNNPEAERNLENIRNDHESFEYIDLRLRPQLKKEAASWFHSKWGVSEDRYLACMDAYLSGKTEYGWYLCLHKNEIAGGLGVIENDFHDRKDLSPNICAVYTERKYRNRGIAGSLLKLAVEDMRSKGISPLYLVTDHTGFYERYGWKFYCMVHCEGETESSRLYIHM